MSGIRGWRDDPVWREARARRAGVASAAARRQRTVESLAACSKLECYRRGYLNGYHAARYAAARRGAKGAER